MWRIYVCRIFGSGRKQIVYSAMHSASAESEIMDSVDLGYTSADAAGYA